MDQSTKIAQARFKNVMANFPTGVAVVTARSRGEMHGMTVNSLTSVSLAPCSILICLEHGKRTTDAVRRSGSFAVHLLRDDQRDLLGRFAGREANKFSGLNIVPNALGVPLIEGCLAHMICKVAQIHSEGDHDIVIGRVQECSDISGQPLTYYRGEFAFLTRDEAKTVNGYRPLLEPSPQPAPTLRKSKVTRLHRLLKPGLPA